MLTHQFSTARGRSKHANYIYLSVIPPPRSVLTQHLLLYTFAPNDSVQNMRQQWSFWCSCLDPSGFQTTMSALSAGNPSARSTTPLIPMCTWTSLVDCRGGVVKLTNDSHRTIFCRLQIDYEDDIVRLMHLIKSNKRGIWLWLVGSMFGFILYLKTEISLKRVRFKE